MRPVAPPQTFAGSSIPRPAPRPTTIEEAMRGTDPRSGYSRADQDLAERRGGEMLLAPLSTLTDEAKETGALQRGTPLSYGLTAAAFLGDLFNPSFSLPIGVPAVDAGVNTARRVGNLDPIARNAYLNSLMGRLVHGSKSSEPFTVMRGQGAADNLFGADFFATLSEQLAKSPGYGAGAFHRLKLPLSEAENLRFLDLMPGAPSIRDQFPGLADELAGMGMTNANIVGSVADTVDPVSLQAANNLIGRHVPFTKSILNPVANRPGVYNLDPNSFVDWGEMFRRQGINALRHESGRLVPGAEVVAPVLAFLDAPAMRAVPGRSFDDVMEGAASAIGTGVREIPARLKAMFSRFGPQQPTYKPSSPMQFGQRRNVPTN